MGEQQYPSMPNRRARQLRQNSTDVEKRMWSALRDRRLSRYKFRRQHPIGPYIVDFACTEHAMIIEIDGGQHAENTGDARRTAWLQGQGWTVNRFWNNEVLTNTNGVIETILRVLEGK
jgi:very-short-patch-repair endonuclease